LLFYVENLTNKIIRWQICWKTKFNIVSIQRLSSLNINFDFWHMDHLWIPVLCNYMKFCIKSISEWIIRLKTKCSTVAAAVLNLFLIASLNMPSSGHIVCHPSTRFCAISRSSTELLEHDGIQDGGHVDSRKPHYWATIGCWLSITISDILINAQIMAQNRISRWRPSAILDFPEFDFWPMGLLRLLILHLHGYQIWCTNVDRRPNYGPKSKFKMVAVT